MVEFCSSRDESAERVGDPSISFINNLKDWGGRNLSDGAIRTGCRYDTSGVISSGEDSRRVASSADGAKYSGHGRLG